MHTALLIAGLLAGGNPAPQAWPAFLGQGATAVDPATIPLTWSPSENIAWTAKLPGKGQSSPVILGDRVYVTGIDGSMKDHCHVTSLDLASGKVVWTKSFPASQTVRSNYFQSRSAPTPVVDSDRVYAFFETGNLVALTHAGDVVWKRSLTDDYGAVESNIGLAASPLLVDDRIVILVDHEGPSYLLAVDRKSGETQWKTDRDSRKSYSSPTLVPVGNARHIVCSSDGSVDGYDPTTGKRLWSFEEVGGNTANTPLPIANGRFLVGASPGMHNEREQMARKSNLCLSVEETADGFVPKVSWRTEQAMPTHASPIVHAGHAYWINRAGVVFCYDEKTGEQRYAQRTKQIAWATPVGLGDRLYLFGKDGLTTVLAAGPEFKVLAENQLWDPEKVGTDPFARDRARRQQADHAGADHAKDGQPKDSQAKDGAKERPAKDGTAGGKPAAAPTGEERRPPMTEKEREENRAKGENRFADPVQYGVALVDGSLVIRTGEVVYCVRQSSARP